MSLPEADVTFARNDATRETEVEVTWYDDDHGGGSHGFTFKVANEVVDRLMLSDEVCIECGGITRTKLPNTGGRPEPLKCSDGWRCHACFDAYVERGYEPLAKRPWQAEAFDPKRETPTKFDGIEDVLRGIAATHEPPSHMLVPVVNIVRAHLLSYRERLLTEFDHPVTRRTIEDVALFEEEDTDARCTSPTCRIHRAHRHEGGRTVHLDEEE